MKSNRPDSNKSGFKLMYWVEVLILLLALWFVMSGIFEAKFIFYGVVSSAVISLVCIRVLTVGGLITDKPYFILHMNWPKFIAYMLWLFKEIAVASWDVTKNVLFTRDELNPHMVWFKADYDNPVARALLANSITLTPGTITVDIYDDGVYSVHALTDGAAEGLLAGGMQRKVARLFGETIDYKVIDVIYDEERKNIEPARVITTDIKAKLPFRKLERKG